MMVTGETGERCTICGRRGLNLHRPYEWEPKYAMGDAGPYPAGAPCCFKHEPVPAARTPRSRVLADLAERLGRHETRRWPDDDVVSTLKAIARTPPGSCPVRGVAGHRIESGGGDFASHHVYTFKHGVALLTACWNCEHTLELAALRDGGPYVTTVAEPWQPMLWGDPQWVVTVRRVSPKLGVGEVDTYWGGPVHGNGQEIPNHWYGGTLGVEAMRFPSPEAAQAALDSVFGPGSRWKPPYTKAIRIVPVLEGVGAGW